MALTGKQKNKVYLIVLLVVVAAALAVVYFGVLKKKEAVLPSLLINPVKEKEDVGFDIFNDPIFKELVRPRPVASSTRENIGRDNPFIKF